MAYDIIIGRDKSDKEKFGNKGLIFLGKGYVKMGNYTSLSNKIWLDVARAHVILVAGKRGSGKSYSLSAIAEGISDLPQETAKNIASIMFDTMGIFWTMKYKNEKDYSLLKEWGLEAKSLPVKVFVPFGKTDLYQEKRIPFDSSFALEPYELEAEDWISLFNLEFTTLTAALIERIINKLKETSSAFSIDTILNEIELDDKASKEVKEIASSLFSAANTWGIFSKTGKGTEIQDLINPGETTILDVSIYSSIGAFNIRALVIGLICKKLFQYRMDSRRKEETEAIQRGKDYLSYSSHKNEPLIWVFIDEIHEFMGKDEKTPATDALIQLLREGRQPGISLVMATQQPGKLQSDALTQSDIILSHRVTSKTDTEALNEIMQTYLLENIKQQMDNLPSAKGSAILLDDNSERIYPIRVRPKFTWHGGEAPSAVKAELKL